jgi:hypothetical protein
LKEQKDYRAEVASSITKIISKLTKVDAWKNFSLFSSPSTRNIFQLTARKNVSTTHLAQITHP